MSKRRAPAKDTARIAKAGDYVLCGGIDYVAPPSHWYIGLVHWAAGDAILIQRSTMHDHRWFEIVEPRCVRVVGTLAEVIEIQRQAGEATRDYVHAIHEAESALGRARDAFAMKLEELRANGLKIVTAEPAAVERIERTAADYSWRNGRDGSVMIYETLLAIRDGDPYASARIEDAIAYAAEQLPTDKPSQGEAQ